MDEKTEELRELFLEVADDETVTESQEEVRGSITVDDDEIEERLRSTIASIEERDDATAARDGAWETFTRDDLVELVRLFYAGEDDADIAGELGGVDAGDVARARVDLHLVTEEERGVTGDRFRREFERILGDRAVSDRLTEGVTEDGLADATEGIETDVSF
jgi:hypothetical protein